MFVLLVLCVVLSVWMCFYVECYVVENIRMNVVLLGFIDSWLEMLEIVVCILVGCFGKIGEIVKMVVFLLLDGVGYIIG